MKKEMKLSIILLLIGIILLSPSFVHAETYNLTTNNVKYYTWTTANQEQIIDGVPDDIRYLGNITAYYRFIQTTELKDNSQVIFPGQYLIEFYVYVKYANADNMSNINCEALVSNFENVNMTTGNWVSNEIKSQCVDMYQTTYNGLPAYRILYKFNYTGADGITELRFSVGSYPNWFYGFTYNDIGMSSSNIYDYDSSLVSQFNDFKQNQTIIAQNGQIISSLDTLNTSQNNNTNSIINNNNQNTQNIINNQDSNTQSVIDNQNQNKEDIINNQNANTDKEIESQQVCEVIDSNKIIENGYLSTVGKVEEDIGQQEQGVTNFISINSNSKLKMLVKATAYSNRICFYNVNKELINCISSSNSNIGEIEIPQNTSYVRFTIVKKQNKPQFEICKTGNQAMNDSINDMKDMDIGDSEKDVPSDEKYQDYEEQEQILKDSMAQADLNTLDIAIDIPTSNFIWDTITSLINSNTLVFGMFIAILSIGVIKLALGR